MSKWASLSPRVAGELSWLMTRIKAVSNDPRYAFMFAEANVGGVQWRTFYYLLRLRPDGKPMTVMQLS